jgi:hypothetical protein
MHAIVALGPARSALLGSSQASTNGQASIKAKMAAMRLRIIFRITVPDVILPAAARLRKTSNYTVSAANPSSVQPTFPRLAGHPHTC